MSIGELGEHPTNVPELARGITYEQPRQRLAIGCDSLSLAERLTYEPTSPESQAAGDARIRRYGLTDPGHDEFRLTGVSEHGQNELLIRRVEHPRDRPVEVSRYLVPHVRLDQAL